MADQPFWNPSDKDTGHTLSNSDKTSTQAASNAGSVRSVAGLSSGKWYVEFDFSGNTGLGLGTSSADITNFPGFGSQSWCLYTANGNKYNNNNPVSYGSAPATSIVGMAVDLDNDKVWWRDANGWFNSGDPAAGTGAAYTNITGTMYLMCGAGGTSGTKVHTLRNLADYSWSPPTGFTAGWGDSGGGPTTYNQSLSATLTATAAIRKTVTKGMSAALSLTATLARIAVFPLHLVANMTAAASIRKEIAKGLSAPITATASIVKTVSKSLSATCSFTAAIAKAFPVHLSASLPASASITKTIAKSLVVSLGLTATMQRVKTAIVHLSASVSLTASLATIRVFQQVLSASITLTASMTKTISKRLVATQSMIARPIRWVATLLAATRGDKPNWNQCARCSRKVRPNKLLQQMEYRGPRLVWTGLYVCSSCIDEPQPQGIWPRETGGDPKPVILARPRRD